MCTAQIICLPEIARLLAVMPAAGRFKAECDANLRFRELRDEAVAEECPQRGF